MIRPSAINLGLVLVIPMLASCSGGGSNVSDGNGVAPFETSIVDEYPAGTRVDVQSLNLFPHATGNAWNYDRFDVNGTKTGVMRWEVTSGPDAGGRVTVFDDDGTPSSYPLIFNNDGVFDPDYLGDIAGPSAENIVGTMPLYVTPLYPQGATRRHLRSGPWGLDLDNDGIGESFRIEHKQTFIGFETIQISSSLMLNNVAHFRDDVSLTLRPTAAGTREYTVFITEESWFAPHLGRVKIVGSVTDSDGPVQPRTTMMLTSATAEGVNWTNTAPPPPPPKLDGDAKDLPIVHNTLIYDQARNMYYATIPGSVIGLGNSIASIDPATGQARYSAPIGSEPNALAISADANTLYVGLNGSGELVSISLPTMVEQGRSRLLGGMAVAERIAASPVDSGVVAISMAYRDVSPRHAGVVLLRDMVILEEKTQPHTGSNLIGFDAAGMNLYGLNNETSEFGLRRIQVLADGLVQREVVAADTSYGTSGLELSGNKIIAGASIFNAPSMTSAGKISGASVCRAQRNGSRVLCVGQNFFNNGRSTISIANLDNYVIETELVYTLNEAFGVRRTLVEGPSGQVAISYFDHIRFFASPQLVTPTPSANPQWPVSSSGTADGTLMDVGILHNSLVYDKLRNLYYASIPGSVIGLGNTIARINPDTGQVMHSTPIGSDPNGLAISADASVLYAGLDGSGEIVKLALPSLTVQGRTHLVADSFWGQSRAERIAVSPIDPNVVAVSMAWQGVSPRHAGVGLLRNMEMQPRRTQSHTGSNLIAFNATGSTLYGLNTETTEFGLRSIDVLSDGLVQNTVVNASAGFSTRTLETQVNKVISGRTVYDAQTLAIAGSISGATDCWPVTGSSTLMCLGEAQFPGKIVVANSSNFVISTALHYQTAEPFSARNLIAGPPGKVAISVPSSVRIFSSAGLP
jgi:hypothetical protein